MSLSDEIAKLRKSLNKMAKGHVKVQTVWAKVKSVDWDKKQMTATGVIDELDYNNVLLGLGNLYRKPVVGKYCLLGLIANNDAATFLIDAEEVEDVVIAITEELQISAKDLTIAITNDIAISANSTVFNGGNNGGLVIVQELVDRLNIVEQAINDLKDIFQNWTPLAQDGGNALKILPAMATWFAAPLTETTVNDIENGDVKH